MSKILNHHDVFYFCIPLDNIPFEKLPVVITERYAYCRYYHVASVLNKPSFYDLIGVYAFLNNEPLKDFSILGDKDFLFGEVISYEPPLRGIGRWSLLGKEPVDIAIADLPHFKFGDKESGFYLKEGKYDAMAGIKTKYENVQHLEESNMNAENSIKLRIVVELLRQNLKALNLEITVEEWEHIAFAVFRNGYGTKKINDSDLWNGVRNLLPNMLKRPIYSEIPKAIRGKALDEVI